MEYTYYTDLNSMLQALAAGIIMGVYYDIFRFARRLFHFSNFSVIIQDIIFWLSSAIYIFFVCKIKKRITLSTVAILIKTKSQS